MQAVPRGERGRGSCLASRSNGWPFPGASAILPQAPDRASACETMPQCAPRVSEGVPSGRRLEHAIDHGGHLAPPGSLFPKMLSPDRSKRVELGLAVVIRNAPLGANTATLLQPE